MSLAISSTCWQKVAALPYGLERPAQRGRQATRAMLRISEIVLLLLVVLWGLIGGIGNLTQIGTGSDYVAAVLNPQKVG